jgi:hypothetical protein
MVYIILKISGVQQFIQIFGAQLNLLDDIIIPI